SAAGRGERVRGGGGRGAGRGGEGVNGDDIELHALPRSEQRRYQAIATAADAAKVLQASAKGGGRGRDMASGGSSAAGTSAGAEQGAVGDVAVPMVAGSAMAGMGADEEEEEEEEDEEEEEEEEMYNAEDDEVEEDREEDFAGLESPEEGATKTPRGLQRATKADAKGKHAMVDQEPSKKRGGGLRRGRGGGKVGRAGGRARGGGGRVAKRGAGGNGGVGCSHPRPPPNAAPTAPAAV
ncbi:unnamed protein product, partial [Closterium sp. NIES-54]